MYNATGQLQKQDLWALDVKIDRTNKLLEEILAELKRISVDDSTNGEKKNGN